MSTEIKTPNLEEIAANYKKVVAKLKRRIIICGGTGCIANGSMKVRDAICAELEKAGEHIEVVLDRHDCSKNEGVTYFSKSGCQGFCLRVRCGGSGPSGRIPGSRTWRSR